MWSSMLVLLSLFLHAASEPLSVLELTDQAAGLNKTRKLGHGLFAHADDEDCSAPDSKSEDDTPNVCKGTGCLLPCLWWVAVLYFFWAQAEVCDEFFVPTIEVISDRFNIPEDVAGSTIMALGCNGPELFLNVIAIIQPSDIGIGAVIGGEVFNVLVLCGCALLATPKAYMPLKLAKFSFTRDCIFYAYSIGLLYWVLYDKEVSLFNALVLLGSAVMYTSTVTLSQTIRKRCARRLGRTAAALQVAAGSVAVAAPLQEDLVAPQKADKDLEDPLATASNPGPKEGCTMAVRVQYDDRIMDRGRQWDDRFIKLAHKGLIISTDADSVHGNRTQRGIVFDNQDGHLHYAGLVNQPGVDAQEPIVTTSHATINSDEPVDMRAEVIPTRDFVSCTPPLTPGSTVFEVQVLQRDHTFGKLVRLEVDAKTPDMCERWVAAIMKCMQEEMRAAVEHLEFPHAPSMSFQRQTSFEPRASFQPRNFTTGLKEWLDWFRFPVRSMLKATIPDVHRPQLRQYWALAFVMCMFWLAVFAFAVIEICEQLHKHFGISTQILGFTVAAVGTSFPNVISCIAVSKQGRTGMAIANALGANIQNVFLALALPWTIQAAISKGQKFCLSDHGLTASVMWMFGTLGLMVVIIMGAGCKMPRWAGGAFLVIYVVFLTNQLGGEISGNQAWPFGPFH